MPIKGGYGEAPRRHGGDRFYNQVVYRDYHEAIYYEHLLQRQLALQQQQELQLQMQLQHEQQLQQQRNHQYQLQHQHQRRGMVRPESFMAAKLRDGGDSSNFMAFSTPRSVRSVSTVEVTNLDSLMESVSPFIQARFISEVNQRGSRMRQTDSHPFFYLEDLWESFVERSAYGAGVPLLLHGIDQTEQFYVPYLSGIQLYVDPSKSSPRLRLPSSTGSNDSEGDRRANPIMQQLDKLSLGNKSSEAKLPLEPVFSFLESEAPYMRKPLADKIISLCEEYPDLAKLRSCDLLPTSWMCVAWYPIYRIPMGSTLRDLDASFLSFHCLSTQPRSHSPALFHAPYSRAIKGFVDPAPRISLPVFALAAYKLKGSLVSPCGPHEREQERSLEQAADNWLNGLKVVLPDYNFFRTHSHPMR